LLAVTGGRVMPDRLPLGWFHRVDVNTPMDSSGFTPPRILEFQPVPAHGRAMK
jgi:hypothetical protein